MFAVGDLLKELHQLTTPLFKQHIHLAAHFLHL